MKARKRFSNRRFNVESLENRTLLSGGMQNQDLPPGALNPSFGNGGVVTSSIFGPTTDVAGNVAIQTQSDGKIVLAGTVRGVTSQSAFAVARENADGSLDTKFGNGGTVFTNFAPGTIATASGLAIQPDGKILVVGNSEGVVNGNFVEEFALARYTTDGTLDTSFGTNGEVSTDVGGFGNSFASSVVVTSAGKIIVTGFTGVDNGDCAIAEYNANGTLNQSFGSGGEVVTNFGQNALVLPSEVSATIQTNGQIVLAGTVQVSNPGFGFDLGLARYNENGSLDPKFGTGGLVTTQFGSSDVFQIAGVGIEPGTSAIVVAGTTEDGFTQSITLARFNAKDGSLDKSFGTGGVVITPPAPEATTAATGMVIQPHDGDIVVSGTTIGVDGNQNDFQDLIVARYNATDGSLDKSFGTNGEVLTAFGPNSTTSGAGVTLQADGKIVATASVSLAAGIPDGNIGVARFNINGRLDSHFGNNGESQINVPIPAEMLTAGEAIQSDGKIVVAGTAVVGGANEFAETVLTRFNTDGSLDRSFGTNGTVISDFKSGASAVGLTIESNGKILVVANTASLIDGVFEPEIGLEQFNTNGTPDKSFGSAGEAFVNVGAGFSISGAGVAIEPNGKIVVAGTESGFDSNFNFVQDFILASLNKNGSVDTSFGTNGQVVTSFGTGTPATAAGIAIQSDGKIVVAGTANDPTSFENEFALARYKTNGSLDSSFGTGGEVLTNFGPTTPASLKSVAIQSDGKIVVAGSITDQTTFTDDFALARYNTNGKLDTSFGTGGKVITSFGPSTSSDAASVAIQPDGEIVVAGTVQVFTGGIADDFGLVRYNPNGTLDHSFGTGGEVLTNFGANEFATAADVVIGADGEIFVAGTLAGNNFSDFVVASFIGKKKHDQDR
jgi:uncharacterized delta-60 repeat protein